MIETISLLYGSNFKAAFSDPFVFSEFVSAVLGFPVKINKVREEAESEVRDKKEKRTANKNFVDVQFDLMGEDHERKIIVEVQHQSVKDRYERFFYYFAVGIVKQVSNELKKPLSDDYRQGKTVYTIVIFTHPLIRETTCIETGQMIFRGDDGQEQSPFKHRLIFLRPTRVNKKTPLRIKKWMEFIKETFKSQINEEKYPEEVFQKILIKLESIQQSTQEGIMYSTWKEEIAQREQMIKAATEDALEFGRELGQKQGQKLGQRLGRDMLIRSMLQRGSTPEQVAKLTGLAHEEIQQAKEEQRKLESGK